MPNKIANFVLVSCLCERSISQSAYWCMVSIIACLGGISLLAGCSPSNRAIPPHTDTPKKTNIATRPPPAYSGALILKRSVAELTTEADRILTADVLAVTSQFSADGSTINTQIVLAVDKVLKGQATDQETLTLPGGQVGDTTLRAGGVPNFIAGERVLLFLDDDSEFGLAGIWQGKYSLSGDEAFQPETGQRVSVHNLEETISRALQAPVKIGTSPQLVHAEFTTTCVPWTTADVPVPHYVNPNNPGTGAPTGASFVGLMYQSLYAWQALSDSWISLYIAGTTTRTATNHFDGNHDIAWTDLSSGILGINYCVYNGNERWDSDTLFNNSNFAWTITAESGKYDLRAVAEHELGHGIGIGHSDQVCNGSPSTPLMCSTISSGGRKTILTDDQNAAASLYPLSGALPAAPSNLTVTISGNSNLLSWSDNASNEHAFEIQRASGDCNGTFSGVATVPANLTTYTDDDYSAGLTGLSCYRVKALNQGGDSGFSNMAANVPLDTHKYLISTNLITAGATISYAITVQNTSSTAITGMTVSDTLPGNTTYIPHSAQANIAMNLSDFPTSAGPFTLNGTSTVTISYTVQVDNSVQRGDLLINTATIDSDSWPQTSVTSTNLVDPLTAYLPLIQKNN